MRLSRSRPVRTTVALAVSALAAGVVVAPAAAACGGLVGENGSIVPLPDVPTAVERGGDWTLQRLAREPRAKMRAICDAGHSGFMAGR
ncbi:MAG TPA: hypothetical protein VK975_01590 [Acidimicrobiales bacterium]|nr:hypothetical protein [Acidimicrobiales bacterium]